MSTLTTAEIAKLREIQKFLVRIRDLIDKDMPVQRLNVLLEVAIRGEIEQGQVIRNANLRRAATSKNVAHLTKLTPYKRPGPDLITAELYPEDLRTRILKLTDLGADVLRDALKPY